MIVHTGLYAGLLGVMLIWLSIRVIRARRKSGTALGDGGEFDIFRRGRAHANFTEYTPVFLILLGLSEMMGLYPFLVHGFGLVFIAGRVMHAYSLIVHERYVDGKLQHFPNWRVRGMVCTFGCIGMLSAYVVLASLMAIAA